MDFNNLGCYKDLVIIKMIGTHMKNQKQEINTKEKNNLISNEGEKLINAVYEERYREDNIEKSQIHCLE